MELSGKVAVVTGGAQGIGEAMCRRFAAEGAAGIVVADLDRRALAIASELASAHAVMADVAVEADVRRIVDEALKVYGRIDLFCSNAGIFTAGGEDTSDADWERIWKINVLAHIYAARAVGASHAGIRQRLPAADRIRGRTSHADRLGAVRRDEACGGRLRRMARDDYGDQGLKVSCLCPQGRADAHAGGR